MTAGAVPEADAVGFGGIVGPDGVTTGAVTRVEGVTTGVIAGAAVADGRGSDGTAGMLLGVPTAAESATDAFASD